jgi:hypothetical protein
MPESSRARSEVRSVVFREEEIAAIDELDDSEDPLLRLPGPPVPTTSSMGYAYSARSQATASPTVPPGQLRGS